MNFFNKLTIFGKVLICILVLAIVSAACWLGGLFNGLGIQSPIIKPSQKTSVDTQPLKKDITQPSTKSSNEKIRISIDEWVGWAGGLLSANGGLTTQPGSINDKNGLNIEYVVINDADQSSAALISGELDGAGYTINRYAFLYDNFIENGLTPKCIYMANSSTGGDGIIAKSGINSIEELYGKKVGVPKFSESMALMDWLVERSSLTDTQKKELRDSMILFNTPDDTAKAFFAGQIDAAATWQPYLSQAQDMTNCKLLFSTKNATNLIAAGFIFDESFVKENEELLVKLVSGCIEANKMYGSNLDMVRESMPIFSLESDESIKETMKDSTMIGLKENKEYLNNTAKTLFADMSDIWAARGESADRNNAENAFTTAIIDKVDPQIDGTIETVKTPKITQEQRKEAAQKVDTASLLKMTADIRFEPNTAVILEESYNEMDKFYDTASLLNGAIIVVEGNISDYQRTGVNTDAGIQLSYERAKAVAKYLQMKGIDPDRFEIVGNGISKQIGDNFTEEGQRQNRRTDLSFMLIE